MEILKLAPEFGCSPLWIASGEPIDPEDIPLSQTLCDRINNWDDKFQATFNDAYPPDSAFKNIADEMEYKQEGLAIYKELATEVKGRYIVVYKA